MQAAAKGSRKLEILALSLAVANLLLWYAAPWFGDSFDAMTGQITSPHRRVILTGVQELFVYFDPWLARGVFPIVYTLGFVAIAFLFRPDSGSTDTGFGSTAPALLLLGLEAVWVSLVAFAILFRGPGWNLVWPWDAGNPTIVQATWLSFSDAFYINLAGTRVADSPWIVRKAPGLFLAAGYLSFGVLLARIACRREGHSAAYWGFVLLMVYLLTPLLLRKRGVAGLGGFGQTVMISLPVIGLVFVASYLLFRLLRVRQRSPLAGRPMACWRAILLVFLVQVAALIPIKVVMYWTFDLRYFI